jgi:hypothetical protein
MIHITKGQPVLEKSGMKVFSATGDYGDNELIECCTEADPALAVCSYQAQFIAYGGMVYRYNTPQELGEEILKVDPGSTHTAASFVRVTRELLSQMNDGSLEPSSLDQAVSDEQAKTEDQMKDTPKEEEATSTDSADDDPDPIVQDNTASSTATSTSSVSQGSATTTPPALDAASSTPPTSADTASSTPALSGDALQDMGSTTPQTSATTTSATTTAGL